MFQCKLQGDFRFSFITSHILLVYYSGLKSWSSLNIFTSLCIVTTFALPYCLQTHESNLATPYLH